MKREKNSLIVAFLKLMKILFKNFKVYFIWSAFLCGLVGLLTSANVLIKQMFFEEIEKLTNNSGLGFTVAIGCFWGVYILITLFLQGISDVTMEDLGIRAGGILGDYVNKKASKIDPIYYEDVEMLNLINKAYQGVEQSSEAIRVGITLVAYYVPYFLFFAIYTYRIHPGLCAIMLLVLLPTLMAQYLRSKYYTHMENNVAPLRRKMDYFRNCIVDREYARETRGLGATKFFRSLYLSALYLFKKEAWKAERKSSLIELALRLISLIAYIIILLLMFHFTKNGFLGIAAFVAILSSIDQMFSFMDYVGNNIGDISSTMPSVVNTLIFLGLPENSGKEVEIDSTNITFDNVSFHYPCNETLVLKNVSLTINSGETIAIVGTNGAGKSTMAKIFLGIFTPTNGNVYFGNNNMREISRESIYKKCSAVFQDFQKYKMSLRQNIQISDLNKQEEDCTVIEKLSAVDINIADSAYPDGLDTLLSKEFGGTDISGGQWQRTSIARGIYRNHEIIVLDEPTAAIDPLEESKIYNQFAKLSRGKTAIIITHRIGSAKIADRIIVMDKGEVVGYGKHEELIKCNKLYKTMFNSQAQWYH